MPDRRLAPIIIFDFIDIHKFLLIYGFDRVLRIRAVFDLHVLVRELAQVLDLVVRRAVALRTLSAPYNLQHAVRVLRPPVWAYWPPGRWIAGKVQETRCVAIPTFGPVRVQLLGGEVLDDVGVDRVVFAFFVDVDLVALQVPVHDDRHPAFLVDFIPQRYYNFFIRRFFLKV